MKKVVFFQLEAGRGAGVNRDLAKALTAAGWQVQFLFLCRAGREPSVPGVRTVVLSPRPWGGSDDAKGGRNPFAAAGRFFRNLAQDRNREKLYARAREALQEIRPDRIVTSHFRVLPGVPEDMLPRTIHHVHRSFAALKNREEEYRALFAYRDRIRFLWLSPAVRDRAASEGFIKSDFLWDPVPFTAARTRVEEMKKVVIVSPFAPEKRLPLLASLLKKTLPLHWRAEFWGDGEDKAALAAAVDRDERLRIRGVTADPKAVYATAAFTVSAARAEGDPAAVLEAAACGVPTLSFRLEGIEEIIRDGETGVLVDPDDLIGMEDALRVLFTSPGWRKELSLAAYETARSFTTDKVKESWLELLEKE